MTESNPDDEDDEVADLVDRDKASGGFVRDGHQSDERWQSFADTRLVASADSMRDFLNAVDDAVSLSAEDELELARRIEAGRRASQLQTGISEQGDEHRRDLTRICREGDQARDDLLKAHQRLVVSIAERYVGRGTAFSDLVQGGGLGLVRAVEKFDHAQGYRFATYAVWWIRHAITRTMTQ
ncbi:hypothetical protein BTO20_14995 [Mycobacterium dioxanotrophicus]|jgi:RNA polymerase primary sigma factor|uniref:RNA polymerase sigma-70 domain-containing protein n=1 Tax=Mycobacterium dioxanotrophicus TaxID=482462 RepID=A0A1Y0C3Q3_9MYCO|nr:sigma-70 family RNA polymerase sigma factor [Mycobacterium dioxanotrophicus]ART69725.1 hypothetical protein BTO20_14995 [Mycobacterium dioxanotrophicus]